MQGGRVPLGCRVIENAFKFTACDDFNRKVLAAAGTIGLCRLGRRSGSVAPGPGLCCGTSWPCGLLLWLAVVWRRWRGRGGWVGGGWRNGKGAGAEVQKRFVEQIPSVVDVPAILQRQVQPFLFFDVKVLLIQFIDRVRTFLLCSRDVHTRCKLPRMLSRFHRCTGGRSCEMQRRVPAVHGDSRRCPRSVVAVWRRLKGFRSILRTPPPGVESRIAAAVVSVVWSSLVCAVSSSSSCV